MKIQIIVYLALLILFSAPINAQIDRTVSFDTCNIFSRQHPDSTFVFSTQFVGEGIFEFYTDSIVVNFSNEWECGKYLIELDNIDGQVYGSDFIWYYSGKDKYRGWDCVCTVIIDNHGKVVRLELTSEYAFFEEVSFAKKTRVYKLSKFSEDKK